MPVLLATGVLGSRAGPVGLLAATHAEAPGGASQESDERGAPIGHPRIPTPLFARIPLEELQVDVARPQLLLDLPDHLFAGAGGPDFAGTGGPDAMAGTPNELVGTPHHIVGVPRNIVGMQHNIGGMPQNGPAGAAGDSAPISELLFLLTRADQPTRVRALGPIAEVALVLRDLFTAIGLRALCCVAGPRALLVRVPIAPAPGPGVLEQFAARIAETAFAQVAPLRAGTVQLDTSLDRPGARVPALLEPLPGTRLVCAPLAWDALSPELTLGSFTPRWLAAHRKQAEALVAAHQAAAAPLPRAR